MNGSVRSVLQVILLVASVLLVAQGIWLFANSRLPSWMKGVWKWPLGDSYPAAVALLLAWASVLAGAACLPTLVLLGLWDRSTTSEIAIVIAMFFAGAASFSSAWCLFLSRTKLA